MARAPFQVLVLLFRRTEDGGVEYGVLCRSDDGNWQGVAGGGEERETNGNGYPALARTCADEMGVVRRGARLAALRQQQNRALGAGAAPEGE